MKMTVVYTVHLCINSAVILYARSSVDISAANTAPNVTFDYDCTSPPPQLVNIERTSYPHVLYPSY